MSLQSIGFSDLASANCAMIDSSSLRLLCDASVSSFLADRRSRLITAEPLRNLHPSLSAPKLNRALDVLARLIAYDWLVVDGSFFEQMMLEVGSASPLGADFVRSTQIPEEIYRSAAQNVLDAAEILEFQPAQSHWLSEFQLHDVVERRHIDRAVLDIHRIPWIRNSDQSAARALFYVELARLAETPIFVTPEKDRALNSIGQRLLRDALRLVQTRVDRAVFNRIYAAVRETYDVELHMDWPPLARYIVSVAYRNEISVYEAALQIRELPAAASFRAWLGNIQRLLLTEGSSASLMKAEKILHEWSTVADEWGDQCSSAFGVRYKHARADLSALPGIGTVLQLAGHAELSLRDPILGRGVDYLTFIAEWYQLVPDQRAAG